MSAQGFGQRRSGAPDGGTESLLPHVPETTEIAAEWDDWLRLFANRDEVAEEYASCITFYDPTWSGFKFFNEAILRRWSPAGLRYIKARAWQ